MPESVAQPVARVRGFPAPAGPLDLDFHRGDLVLLRGANGSGKTSLLRALAGLDAPLRPLSALVAGHDPRSLPAPRLAEHVGFAMQDPAETLAGLTVAGEFRLRARPLPADLLDLADRDVATLSSGEARRVALAVLSTSDVPLLLLDEPAEGLDADARQRLLRLVDARQRDGAIVATDHTGLLAGRATRVVELSPTRQGTPPRLPAVAGAVVLEAPAQTVPRGESTVRLPPVALGPGFHVVRGPNAAGKSTLLLALAGLLEAEVRLDDKPPVPGGTTQLLLPRAADLFTHDDVAAELHGIDDAQRRRFVPEALLARHPLSLSAGEAQRVALTKALGRPARAYLLDEPEAHLDAAGRDALTAAIADLVAAGGCVVAATHDPALQALAHTTVAMEGR